MTPSRTAPHRGKDTPPAKTILVTSGPTRASLDALRFLTNRSTGRFGMLVATEALRRGAHVTLVYGIGSETPPPHPRLRLVPVETNLDLETALREHLTMRRFDAVIHAMAVLDFQPHTLRRGKVGSRVGTWIIHLRRAPKIIRNIKRWAPKTFLIGFKLEVGLRERQLFERARRLLKESGADAIVANQFSEGQDQEHPGYLMNAEGRIVKKVFGKRAVARAVVDLVLGADT